MIFEMLIYVSIIMYYTMSKENIHIFTSIVESELIYKRDLGGDLAR